jgi:hypothetical protein
MTTTTTRQAALGFAAADFARALQAALEVPVALPPPPAPPSKRVRELAGAVRHWLKSYPSHVGAYDPEWWTVNDWEMVCRRAGVRPPRRLDRSVPKALELLRGET